MKSPPTWRMSQKRTMVAMDRVRIFSSFTSGFGLWVIVFVALTPTRVKVPKVFKGGDLGLDFRLRADHEPPDKSGCKWAVGEELFSAGLLEEEGT